MKQLRPLPTARQVLRARFLLRLGLAAVFAYAAVAATLYPDNWIGYLPLALRHLAPASLLLAGFSAFQAALAIWLLTGWRGQYAAIVTAVTTVAIMAVNLGSLDITFRDIAIIFAACALTFLS
jgi:hypothetical protein